MRKIPRKYTIEQVKFYIEIDSKSGCKLIDEQYTSIKEKLNILCPCGEKFQTSFNTFKYNQKMICTKCSLISKKELLSKPRQSWDYNKVKKMISDGNYQMISSNEEYVDTINSFEVKCDKGHLYKTKVYDFKNGHRCLVCKQKEIGIKNTFTLSYVKEVFSSSNEGYTVISDNYVGAHNKLIVKCENDHISKISYNSFLSGVRCKKCAVENQTGENNCNWQGGITPERTKIMQGEEYKSWRLNVFLRDSYTCRCCDKKSFGDLEAHHLNNFRYYIDQRFSVDNGLTLCKYCHNSIYKGSFHNTYGTQNNTIEQYYEYLVRRKNGEFDEYFLEEVI